MLNVENYSPLGKAANCQIISDNTGTRYMSYNTVIAFDYDGKTLISDNKWSVTTGKHKSYIKKYVSRYEVIEHELFTKLYAETFNDQHKSNY